VAQVAVAADGTVVVAMGSEVLALDLHTNFWSL
jgi:hypothetical protein